MHKLPLKMSNGDRLPEQGSLTQSTM